MWGYSSQSGKWRAAKSNLAGRVRCTRCPRGEFTKVTIVTIITLISAIYLGYLGYLRKNLRDSQDLQCDFEDEEDDWSDQVQVNSSGSNRLPIDWLLMGDCAGEGKPARAEKNLSEAGPGMQHGRVVRKKTPRVLLALGWYDQRVHQGIANYALKVGWHLCADVTKEKVIPWGWEGDGILAWLGAGDDLAQFVVEAKLPTVDFSFRRPQLPFPRVLACHVSAARLAAEHFLVRGLTHFMFYSAVENWSFDESGKAFVEILGEGGHDCTWIRWHQSPAFTTGHSQWKDKRRWLAAQLKQAPKPLALFAASDDHALEVVETCEAAGLAVPEDVSIIGMDNAILAADAMRTPISSVDRNLETLGYRGAELLDRLMHGKHPPREPIRIPSAGLIARKSSDLLAVNHGGVARSLRYIWDNCHKPISVEDLVSIAGMSRSGLHQAFLEYIGRPPGSELHRARIEKAKKLLAQTELKLEAVAEMAGYRSANSFWVAFKQATGVSPKQYQKEFCV